MACPRLIRTSNHNFLESCYSEKVGFNKSMMHIEEVIEKKAKKKHKKAKVSEHENPEETARKLLLDNKGLWERLVKKIANHT